MKRFSTQPVQARSRASVISSASAVVLLFGFAFGTFGTRGAGAAQAGYSVTLAATSTTPAVGGSVTLTATANQDVGPTPYGLSIVDSTTNTMVVHVTSGSTLSTTVSESSAMSQTYIGEIGGHTGTVVAARSTPITVTWAAKAAAPVVTSVSPNTGPSAGGTSVTVTGSGFSGATAVKFGSLAARSFSVPLGTVSATSLTAIAPAGSGAVNVTVTTSAGTSATSSADTFTYASAAPVVTSASPNSGVTTGGTPVTVTGSGFSGATAVKFGSVAVTSFSVASATSLTAVAPAASSAGAVDITVTTPAGVSATSSADTFTYAAVAPTYSVTLSANTTAATLAVGTSVTLTATANQDVGATPYGLSIVDTTTNTVLAHVGSGSTTSVTVTEAAPTSQTYVGQIDTQGGAPIAATSSPMTFTWMVTNVAPSFTADTATASATVGSSYSYTYAATGTPAPAFSVTSGSLPPGLSLNSTSGVLSGAPTTASTSPYTFVVSATNSLSSVAGTSQSIAVTSANSGYAVTLASTSTTPAVGSSVTLTATANQDVGPTPYGLTIVDSSTNTVLVHVGSGSTLSTTVSQSNATSQTYFGEIGNAAGTTVVATSNPIVVTWTASNLAPTFTADSATGSATVGASYSYTYAATGTPSPTFSVSSGALPPGLSLNSTSGVLSGAPTTVSASPYTFVVSAANSVSIVVGVSQSITVTNAVVIQRAATFPLNSESAMNSSITVNPQKVGDLVVLSDQLHSTSITVTSVTGGNSGTWHLAEQFVDTPNTLTYQVWYAVATSTGSSKITLTYSASTTLPVELLADSFTSSRAVTWSVVASGGLSNGSSSAVPFPTLTSGSAPGELYWGASEEHGSGVAGSSSGFVYGQTSNANEYLYNAALATNSAYTPSAGTTPVGVSTSVGVIFSEQ